MEKLLYEIEIILGDKKLVTEIKDTISWVNDKTDKMGRSPLDPERILLAYKNVCLLGSFEHQMRLVREILMHYILTGVDWLDICIDHAQILQKPVDLPKLPDLADMTPRDIKFSDYNPKQDSRPFYWEISKKRNHKKRKK